MLTTYPWDVLSVNANRMKQLEEYTQMFESRISAGATEKLPGCEKPHAQTAAWSHDMEGHAQKCVERYWEQANKKVEQFKQEELESVGELSQVYSQILLKCLNLARIGLRHVTVDSHGESGPEHAWPF